MDWIGLAALVTAICSGLTTVLTAWWTRNRVERVHKIVNSQRTEMIAEIARLQELIQIERGRRHE